MKYKTVVKAGMKRHRGSLFGIFILITFIALALSSVLTIWINSGTYIRSEIRRAGFGDLTAWVSGIPNLETVVDEVKQLKEIEKVETQDIIFSDYVINGQESDSEGQLISFVAKDSRYKFFTDDFTGYREDVSNINTGEIYVSPSLISMFGVKIGDIITFPIARNEGTIDFIVKGFYEDPFMGSSMIGMKGFLISKANYTTILPMIEQAGFNALARAGNMIHIFSEKASSVTIDELNSLLNENTELSKYMEFSHSETTMYGFMLILQNAFCGLLIAFVIVLLCATMVVVGHSISNTIETDSVNMGILKTIGFTSRQLRQIQLMQYLIGMTCGIFLGFMSAMPLGRFLRQTTLTTTGILYPIRLPFGWCFLSFALILMLFAVYIHAKTARIDDIAPLKTIQGEKKGQVFIPKNTLSIRREGLSMHIAIRQLITGKRRYIGSIIVAILLVFFASIVGRMDAWLGPSGEGMMDAFNPADLDIGVQIFGNQSTEEIEEKILSFSGITDRYYLAMPNVAVNGIDYTANVISNPERFHMRKGETCSLDNEVVLTEFVAANLGVSIGDTLTIGSTIGSGKYVVSGIYQCANDMGDNIGMSREGYLKIAQDNKKLWCEHLFLSDASQKDAIKEALDHTYGGDVHVHENSWPGLFGIIKAMRALVAFMYGMVILFILIVTVMTGSKILSQEQTDLEIYKAIGFSTRQLRMTFAFRFGIVALLGSLVGIILATIFTDPLISTVMKLAGISNFSSNLDWITLLFPGFIVTFLFTCFAYMAAGKLKEKNV